MRADASSTEKPRAASGAIRARSKSCTATSKISERGGFFVFVVVFVVVVVVLLGGGCADGGGGGVS
eukprot:2719083-Rhodomonas_salina.3